MAKRPTRAPLRMVAVLLNTTSSHWAEVERGALERLRREPGLDCSWQQDLGLGPYPDWLAGLIVRNGNATLERELCHRGPPTINLSNYIHCALPHAGPDNQAVGRLAAETFVALGLRDAVFAGDDSFSSSMYQQGFEAVAKRHGLALPPLASQAGAVIPSDLLGWSQGRPVGVFAANDQIAMSVLKRCLVARIGVPQQISVLGVGNNDRAIKRSPLPLSSIELPGYGIGQAAAEMLLDWMAHPDQRPADRLLPPLRVVQRATTAPMASDDPLVATALNTIRQAASRRLTVMGLTRQLKTRARRTLERHFRKALGHGIHAELVRARLAQAKELLLQSSLSIKEIAYRCRFSSQQKFANVFHRHEGCSPREYRQRAGRLGKGASPRSS